MLVSSFFSRNSDCNCNRTIFVIPIFVILSHYHILMSLYVAAPVCGYLTDRFDIRIAGVMSTLCSGICIALTAMCPNIESVIVTIGIMAGRPTVI